MPRVCWARRSKPAHAKRETGEVIRKQCTNIEYMMTSAPFIVDNTLMSKLFLNEVDELLIKFDYMTCPVKWRHWSAVHAALGGVTQRVGVGRVTSSAPVFCSTVYTS